MISNISQNKIINELKNSYKRKREAIQARLKEFSQVPASEYFYELAFCLLTPQSSAVNADSVIQKLKKRRFFEIGFNTESILRDKEHYIRFHRNKAKYLSLLRIEYKIILPKFFENNSPQELRSFLVDNVRGLGLKESTHFLRNIGRNGNLAILDRHILKKLVELRVIPDLPTSISRKTYYLI